MLINTDFRTCKLRMVSRLPVYHSQTDIVYERPRALWVWNNWCLVHTNVHLVTNIAARMTWRSVTRWNKKGGWTIQQLCIVTWTSYLNSNWMSCTVYVGKIDIMLNVYIYSIFRHLLILTSVEIGIRPRVH